MSTYFLNRSASGIPVQRKIYTVAELAAKLRGLMDHGLGDMPVFASDARARYPLSTVVPYTASGYAECLLIQPQPHLHAAEEDVGRMRADCLRHINAEADRIRATCGAFHA